MRLLSCSLTLIAIASCCLLIACGDDRNLAGSGSSLDPSLGMFWRTYDLGDYEYFASITEESGGAIVIGGLANVEAIDSSVSPLVSYTGNQAILLKCLPNGDTSWTTTFGNETYSESVVAVTPDLSGGFIAAVRQSYIGGPGTDFSVQPISGDGVLGLGVLFNQDQYDDVYDIRRCSDGNFILSGRKRNFGPTRDKAYVLKINPGGGLIWQKTFVHSEANLKAERVLELPDRTLLTAGIYNPADGTGTNLHVLRLSATGDSLHGAVVPIEGYTEVKDIAATSDGGYKILLHQENDQGACAIVRIDSLGEITSAQYSFRGGYFNIEDGEFTPDGGAILCGNFETGPSLDAGLLIKLDASGVIEWEREFQDPDASIYFNSVIAYSGGGYVIAGARRLLIDDSYESLLAGTDKNGNVTGAP